MIEGEISGYEDYFLNAKRIIIHRDINGLPYDSVLIDKVGLFDVNINEVVSLGDKYMMWGAALNTSTLDEQLYVCYLDEDLNILDDFFIGDPDIPERFQGMLVNKDGDYIFTGWTDYLEINNLILWQFDTSFLLLNSFMENDVYSYGTQIIYLEAIDKYYANLGGQIGVFSSSLELENIFETTIYYEVVGMAYPRYIALNDSSFAITSITGLPDVPELATGVFFIDSEYNISDSIYIRNELDQNPGALSVNNEGYVFCCNTISEYAATSMGSWESWVGLHKISPDGELLWNYYYGGDQYYFTCCNLPTNDGGCWIIGSRYDWQNHPEQMRNPFLIKVNANGDIVVGMEEMNLQKTSFFISPNPGKDFFYVNSSKDYMTIELYDLTGKKAHNSNINKGKNRIKTNHLFTGTYIYRILSDNGLEGTGKWIKN